MVGPSHPTGFQPYHCRWCSYGTELTLFSKFSCLILLRTINGTVLEFSEYLNSWHCFLDETFHEYVLESVSCVCLFNPKLVKKVRLILLVPEGILFLLESWKGVCLGWQFSAQVHRAVWDRLHEIYLERGGIKLHLSRPQPCLGICFLKAPQAISVYDQLGGKHWGLGELIWC